jgi:Xaa-Pro aminopeptidase
VLAATTGPAHGSAASFSEAELARRREAGERLAARAGVRHLVAHGANRAGSAVPWLTRWPVTREAWVVLTPGHPVALVVGFHNHVPQAREVALECDVRSAGEDGVAAVLAVLAERGGPAGGIGLVGPVTAAQRDRLAAAGRTVGLDAGYGRLRLVKSPEEIEALRRGAALTDLAAAALQAARPGATDHQVIAEVERAYVSRGGLHHIHYLGVTSMEQPDRVVPAQWPTGRRLCRGDVVTCELSAAAAPEYPGQLLRTFTVGEPATPEVKRLHDVAEQVFGEVSALLVPGTRPRDLARAAAAVLDAGFTTVDDVVHGFGGGYLPPVVPSPDRALPDPDEPVLAVGMAVVVQPNVVARGGLLGVQTGELMVVGADGPVRLHGYERGLLRIA